MARHLVTARLIVRADGWEDAEAFVRMIATIPGIDGELYVDGVHWEEELPFDPEWDSE